MLDPTCVLLPPHIRGAPPANTLGGIAGTLATHCTAPIAVAKAFLWNAQVEQWGKVHHDDSSKGDTMRASTMGSTCDDFSDASHVCVCTLTHFICNNAELFYSMRC